MTIWNINCMMIAENMYGTCSVGFNVDHQTWLDIMAVLKGEARMELHPIAAGAEVTAGAEEVADDEQ